MRVARWLTLVGVAGNLAGGVNGELLAQASVGNLESQVKAAFIVKFASFIEWPATAGTDTNAAPVTDTNSPFVIGILGRDPFGKSFDEAVKSEHVKERPIAVRRSADPEKLVDCQIVFVAGSELEKLEQIVANLGSRPVLLVTDGPGAAQRGSAINFVKEEGKVRFEINLATAERAHLKLSAKLQQVGRIVVPARAEEGGNP